MYCLECFDKDLKLIKAFFNKEHKLECPRCHHLFDIYWTGSVKFYFLDGTFDKDKTEKFKFLLPK